MENFELLSHDKELNDCIDSINKVNEDNLLACHGRYHVTFVVNTIEYLLTELHFEKDRIELAKIAGLLHDIGVIEGKKGHAKRSSQMCIYFLDKTKLLKESKDLIIQAIKDHSNGDDILSPVGASLLLADKIDLSKKRVLALGEKDRWHRNLLNIEEIQLTVEKKNMIINYTVNDHFSQEIFQEEWKKGITIPMKAARYFGCNCIFQLNGNTVELT